MRGLKAGLVCLALATLTWRPAIAQRLKSGFATSAVQLYIPRQSLHRPYSLLRKAPDHRWEGVIIGATAGGISLAFLGHAICRSGDSVGESCTGATIRGAAVGIFIGGITGGLIGGLFPKAK